MKFTKASRHNACEFQRIPLIGTSVNKLVSVCPHLVSFLEMSLFG
jgi:hypothetical protein